MNGKKYSLADYILTITPEDTSVKSMFGILSVGGQGSYMGSVSVSYTKDLWETNGYATGAYTHTKNLDRTGTCDVTLNQLSDEVSKFIKLCNLYFNGDYNGCTLSVSDRDGNNVAICNSCYIKRIPTQEFRDTASDQTWSFGCGEISIQ